VFAFWQEYIAQWVLQVMFVKQQGKKQADKYTHARNNKNNEGKQNRKTQMETWRA
jgi:hypothetical protein